MHKVIPFMSKRTLFDSKIPRLLAILNRRAYEEVSSVGKSHFWSSYITSIPGKWLYIILPKLRS